MLRIGKGASLFWPLAAVLACAETQTPFEPLPLRPPSARANLPASASRLMQVENESDPGWYGPLPSYPDALIAAVAATGMIAITSNHPSKQSSKSDPSGYWREDSIQGCYVKVVVTYSVQGTPFFPACAVSPPDSTRTDSILVQGDGVLKRTGKIAQWSYECGSSDCWSYSGEQTFSITPLSAAINLTSSRTETSPGVIALPPPGTWVTIQLKATPEKIKSHTVPIRVISWTWAPRPGGDGQTVVQCTGTKILCNMYFTETGVLSTTAVVNGVEQTDSLVVQAPEVQITTQQASMLPSVRYTKISGGQISRPSKQVITVSVIGPNGPTLNKPVTLTLSAKDGTAGHVMHPANSKPKGNFRTSGTTIQLNTGTTGLDTVTFVAPDPSGPVTVTGTSSGARTGASTVKIEVPGLVKLPAGDPTYALTGHTDIHPDNHYVTPNALGFLIALAHEYSLFDGKQLMFNDSALESGGLFDNVDNTGYWTVPHRTHRFGRETDLKTQNYPDPSNNLNQDDKDTVRWLWKHRYKGVVAPEGDHWHLTI